MTENTHPIVELTQDGLDSMLHRAMRNTLIIGLVAALIVCISAGWKNAAMLATGALISAASIWEWQRLARLIAAKMDKQKTSASTSVVVLFFVLRFTVFAGVIYGSLKCFRGSTIALVCGLGLAVVTVGWQTLRLLRD
jgi:uncharacterized membrane protein